MGPIEAADAAAQPPAILCADDYAVTAGVSAGIEELARLQRLSATSVIVNTRHWQERGARILAFADGLVLGLHLNLTLGAPVSRMPVLAPAGTFPPLFDLLRRAASGRLDAEEIRNEVLSQIELFNAVAGRPPDMIDGHQHVHAFPGVRGPVLEALASCFPRDKPLVRDSSDRITRIFRRGVAVAKASALTCLTAGFGRRARKLGFPTNSGFSGVSTFSDDSPYEDELRRSLGHAGRRHLVMCHPGYPDEELERLDPVVGRRRSELRAIKSMPELPTAIWHPHRSPETGRFDWPGTS
jgi:predicted glycoside hydrolase/deacetylase ChbG (UPF0249 family)